MTASDEFKEKLQAANEQDTTSIFEALQIALSEAIELKITTWVAPADSSDLGLASNKVKPGYRLRTRINIVDGDIDNEIGSQFLDNGPYPELRTFHSTQVKEGREILQQNLENLQRLLGILVNTLEYLSNQARRRLEQSQGANQASLPSTSSRTLTPGK